MRLEVMAGREMAVCMSHRIAAELYRESAKIPNGTTKQAQ